jgi:hypothetical protein
MTAMKPTPTPSTIPCYAADGTSLGYRPIDAAQRLVSGGYVRPAYGRKGHLRAIWLLRDDGSSPVQSRAHNGTRYSYIESLATGRCWQLRRLDRRDSTTPDGTPVTGRDAFLRVVRDCMTTSPDALAASVLPGATPTDSLPIALATKSLAAAKREATAPIRATLARSPTMAATPPPPQPISNIPTASSNLRRDVA